MTIGKTYVKDTYNCASFVAEWYRDKLSIDLPVTGGFEFTRQFVVWMRKHFTEIKQPENHCLVLMQTIMGEYHVGVWYDYSVWHNVKPDNAQGGVCRWTLNAVKTNYQKVNFYQWSQ